MNTINLTANIVVAGGPAIPVKRTIEAEAYELLDFKVPADTTDLKAELQPGTGMSLLAVTADWYGDDLTFGVTRILRPPGSNSTSHCCSRVVPSQPWARISRRFFISRTRRTLLRPKTPR